MKIKGKIRNKNIWVFVILVWAAVLLYLGFRQNYYREEKIVEAFMQTPYNAVECKAEAFGELSGSYLIEEEREKLVKEIAGMLGISEPYSLEHTQNGELQSVMLCKPSKHAVTNIVYRLKTEKDGQLLTEARQFVTISITLSDSVDGGIAYKEMLERIFRIYGIEGQSSLCFNGEIAGNMSLVERSRLADNLIGDMSAKVVREYRGDDLFTIYGYSGRMEEYEEIGGEKINFNLAVSYDEEKDVTSVYLATPYMMEDY